MQQSMRNIKENTMSGWISIYRSIKDHWLWPKGELTQLEAWLQVLMECNHSDKKVLIGYVIFECKRGESLNSLDQWSGLFKWNKSKTRRFFDLLENESMIARKRNAKTTHLRVCNYDDYQDHRHANDTHPARKRHPSDIHPTPNNKGNNINNDNKERDASIISIIEYLNKKTCKNFSTKARNSWQILKRLFDNGRTEEDIRWVIDRKTAEWKDNPKMDKYLRPSTLFGPENFEEYVNERVLEQSVSSNGSLTNDQKNKLYQMGMPVTEIDECEVIWQANDYGRYKNMKPVQAMKFIYEETYERPILPENFEEIGVTRDAIIKNFSNIASQNELARITVNKLKLRLNGEG